SRGRRAISTRPSAPRITAAATSIRVTSEGLRFLQRRPVPALEGRPPVDGGDIGRRRLRQVQLITVEARRHRRVEGIGDAGVAEQEGAIGAKALTAVLPQDADAPDIR